MATVLGKILRGAAIGVGSVLSLISPVAGNAILTAVGTVKKTVDTVTRKVDENIASGALPPVQTPTTPAAATKNTISWGFIGVVIIAVYIGLKALKIIR